MRQAFTTRSDAVMAGNTIVHETGMVNGCRNPLLGAVTNITFFDSRYVCGVLTGSNYTIMTTGTHTQYFGMVDTTLRYRYPGCGRRCMAGFAHISGIDMVDAFS